MPLEPSGMGTRSPIEVATDLDRAFAAVRAGDAAAFADWLRLVEIPLRQCLRPFARSVDVEAVLQEGLLRMWLLAPRLELAGANASLRYALRLVGNLARSEARRLRVLAPLDLDALERQTEISTAPDPPPDPALRRIIRACIEGLPPRPRAALMARIEDGGLSPDRDLAASLHMQVNTFWQNIVRARRLVRTCLKRAGVALAEVQA